MFYVLCKFCLFKLIMSFQFSLKIFVIFIILCEVYCKTRVNRFIKNIDQRCTNVTGALTVSSLVACCRACLMNTECTAVNYAHLFGHCELSHDGSGVVAASGWTIWRKDVAECLPGWMMVGDSACLYLHDNPLTQADAEAQCKARVPSAHLVHVKTQDKWTMLEAWLQEQPLSLDPGVWLGGKWNTSRSAFEWTDSQLLGVGFEHWSVGEPNRLGEEQCLSALSILDFFWADVECNELGYGVCEYTIL